MRPNSKVILPCEPGYTGHWEKEKRRKETREWLREREQQVMRDRISAPGAPWTKQDLFFLKDSLRHGRSFAEAASFLRINEDEVRVKAKELKLTCQVAVLGGNFQKSRFEPASS